MFLDLNDDVLLNEIFNVRHTPIGAVFFTNPRRATEEVRVQEVRDPGVGVGSFSRLDECKEVLVQISVSS